MAKRHKINLCELNILSWQNSRHEKHHMVTIWSREKSYFVKLTDDSVEKIIADTLDFFKTHGKGKERISKILVDNVPYHLSKEEK